MVEGDNLEVALELRRNKPPHILVAAEAMGEHHAPTTAPPHVDVISSQYIHA
jgi:hypothetical protein